MKSRALVKASATKCGINFRVINPAEKYHRNFSILREDFENLETRGAAAAHDGGSFALMRRILSEGVVFIRFVWLSSHDDGRVTGWKETVKLPFESLRCFVRDSAGENGPSKWSALSMESRAAPKFVFCGEENLHSVLGNQLVRRKLVKFLRSNFRWQGTDEIRFYNDFVPYSFFFREFRDGQPGMCGGLILHGQENMAKAQYSIHT
nr:hypothetical protein [uncultured Oscillibacter sp.]